MTGYVDHPVAAGRGSIVAGSIRSTASS